MTINFWYQAHHADSIISTARRYHPDHLQNGQPNTALGNNKYRRYDDFLMSFYILYAIAVKLNPNSKMRPLK